MNQQSFKVTLASLCVMLVAASGLSASPVDSAPAAAAKPSTSFINKQDREPIPFGNDGSLFLAGTECGPDEQLAPGQLPTCEPTCANPKPFCPKMFFSGVDYVPCFCKAPLVRNQQSKQCVPLSECPPAAKRPEPSRW